MYIFRNFFCLGLGKSVAVLVLVLQIAPLSPED